MDAGVPPANGEPLFVGEYRTMDFEQYYLELFEFLNASCRKIASGNYEAQDAEKLFEIAKKGRYPGFLAELAESFGMMMVKVEAREYRLKQLVEELEKTRRKLENALNSLRDLSAESRIGR